MELLYSTAVHHGHETFETFRSLIKFYQYSKDRLKWRPTVGDVLSLLKAPGDPNIHPYPTFEV